MLVADPRLSDLRIAETVVLVPQPSSRSGIESPDLVRAALAHVPLGVLHCGVLLFAQALVLEVVALRARCGVDETVCEELAVARVRDATDWWCSVIWLVRPEVVHPVDELALPVRYV